jgi:phosphohistidine phosphatase
MASMRLYVVRHAVALERGTPGIPDGERWLTAPGRKKFRKVAKTFSRVEDHLSAIYTSPLVRAAQTAEILAEAAGYRGAVEIWSALGGGAPSVVVDRLRKLEGPGRVAIVGHEPQLSEVCARLLGERTFPLGFPKGGVAALDVGQKAVRFRWLLVPRDREFVGLDGKPVRRPR